MFTCESIVVIFPTEWLKAEFLVDMGDLATHLLTTDELSRATQTMHEPLERHNPEATKKKGAW